MKKVCIVSMGIFIAIIFLVKYTLPEESKVLAILDKSVLPEYHLIRASESKYPWAEFTEQDFRYYKEAMGIDLKELIKYETKEVSETWCSITNKEWEVEGEKPLDQQKIFSWVHIEREYMFNKEHARMYVKAPVFKRNLDEGSITGKKIGDVCWSNRSRFINGKNRYIDIIFVKNNIIVRVCVMINKGKVLPIFAEKVALAVASKL